MIQFTSEEVDKLRKKSKAYPLTIEKLKRDVEEVFHGKQIVPKRELPIGRFIIIVPIVLFSFNLSGKVRQCISAQIVEKHGPGNRMTVPGGD